MRALALFAIGLVFGGGIGFVIAAGLGVTFDDHDHSDAAHHYSAMEHRIDHDTPLEVSAAEAPTIGIELTPDPMLGHNLHIMVKNFEFSPMQASLVHTKGQGHAHVFVNGVKQGRIYGPWIHLADLPKGDVTVEVSLNSNDHRVLSVNGDPLTARTTLTVD